MVIVSVVVLAKGGVQVLAFNVKSPLIVVAAPADAFIVPPNWPVHVGWLGMPPAAMAIVYVITAVVVVA